ncbi:MAG: ABC transporter permease [Chloroflexota bacterium]
MSLVAEDRLERNFTYEFASGALVPVLAVVFALIIGGLVVLAAGSNPINGYVQLAEGAFGGVYNISETLVAAIPLMLTGLAVAFAFRGGLFNIGAEGQFTAGAILSTYVGISVDLPGILLIPLAMLAGAAAGAFWAGIAGLLKAWRGAHEVITTMMLSYTSILILYYLVQSSPTGAPGPMAQRFQVGVPETPPAHAFLPIIIPGWLIKNDRLSLGLLIALAAAVLFWFLLWRSTVGYKIRAVGLNQKAAGYAGINVGGQIVLTMIIAGALAGLGGMVEVFGLAPYTLTWDFSSGFGFTAIAVALLGRNNAVGTILAAILFGAFVHGGAIMQANANISTHLVDMVQGLIIFFIGADALIRYLARHGYVHLPLWRRERVMVP